MPESSDPGDPTVVAPRANVLAAPAAALASALVAIVLAAGIGGSDAATASGPAPEQPAGPGCEVLAPAADAELVVHGGWTDGRETTEYLPGGDYRIARCDATGNLVEWQEVEIVEVDGSEIPILGGVLRPDPSAPPPPRGEQPLLAGAFMTFPDPERTDASDWRDAAAAALPPTPTPAAGTIDDHDHELTGRGPCAGGGFTKLWRLDRHAAYEVHTRSLPHGRRTMRRIVAGHAAWNRTRNRCGLRDRTGFRMPFAGPTRSRVRQGDGRDGVDFGSLAAAGCVVPALACAIPGRGWIDHGGLYVPGEVDIRFAQSYPWWSGRKRPPARRYDVGSVAAHEAGHKLGLGHVGAGSAQTMCAPCGKPGSIRRRTLGRGDVRGLRSLYAGRALVRDSRYGSR